MENKKSIIALLLVTIIGIVGLTIAYFTSSTSIENEFQSNEYGTTVEEVFVSPDDWIPGSTTPKKLTVTNSGHIDQAVRVYYEEEWKSDNGDDLPLRQNGNTAALINWANSSDWKPELENNKVYYYYNYKLVSGEETSTLLESVTFNPLISNESQCNSTLANGTQMVRCTSTGDGYDGATYTLTFTIETVQYDKYKEVWGTNVQIGVSKTEPQIVQGLPVNSMISYYNVLSKNQMFMFVHNDSVDFRYLGDDPYNYIEFNCDDDGTNCELWRIIGVFDVERLDPDDNTQTIKETRIKLVRGYGLTDTMIWDRSTFDGLNNWNTSTLKTFLNGNYYDRINNAESYGLKSSAKNKIDDAKFYLGGEIINGDFNYGNAEDLYTWERGTTVYSSNPVVWIGKVGLMYPSDQYFTYSKNIDSVCYNNPTVCYQYDPFSLEPDQLSDNPGYPQTGWIYNSNIKQGGSVIENSWFLTPGSDSEYFAFVSDASGYLYDESVISEELVRPVVYLKHDIEIGGGTGKINDPYYLTYN